VQRHADRSATDPAGGGFAFGVGRVETWVTGRRGKVFADRAYLDDGTLVPRGQPDAVIHGAEASLAHVLRMVEEQALVSIGGKRIPVKPQNICRAW
jgi:lactam utilization protein B